MANRRHYKKKRGYRRRKRYNAPIMQPRYKGPLTVKVKSKMCYVAPLLQLSASAGSLATYVFSANGLYDPDITGVGHQPRGFDELMGLYNHYTVIGASCTTKWNTNVANGQLVCLAIQGNPNVESNIVDYSEQGNCVTRALADNTAVTITTRVAPLKYLGGKKLGDDDVQGSVSSNPDEQVYFHCACARADGVSAPDASLYVELNYIVVFHEPKDIISS